VKESEEPNVFELIVNQGAFFGNNKYLLQAESQDCIFVVIYIVCLIIDRT
jgi:hypothetical protein